MLDELRKKPRILRENYAFWGALLLTGLVAVVWLVSMPFRFSDVDVLVESEPREEYSGAMSNFFAGVKENLSAFWNQEQETNSSLNEEETASSTENQADQAETVDTNSATTSSESPRSPIRIATSSSRSAPIATSSEQSE